MTAELALDDLREQYRRDYDPYNPVTIAEHLADIADRREKVPVSYSARGNGCWVLTRYDDISSVLRRSNRGFISFPNDPDGSNPTGKEEGMIPVEIDGPRHKQFRALLDPYFSTQKVALLEDTLRESANRLIDRWIEDGQCDFVEGFALPFPGVTVLTIMGWPLKDLHTMNDWVSTLLHGVVGGTQEETDAARGKAHGEMREYMLAMIAERRIAPRRDDVTSAALDAEIDGRALTDLELFDLFLTMTLAGLDTVQSVLAQSMTYLSRHPEQWDEMFASPENLVPAIEELLRCTAPPVPTRTVVDDSVEVGGVTIPKGERVHFPVAAANRDPKYYPDPDEVRFDRDARPHLAFGMGPHRCLGLNLARLELKIAFTELHRRIPKFELVPGTEPHEHLGLAWGVENVHLKFPAAERETPRVTAPVRDLHDPTN
ncbi:cytochrome P450 [Rhodococcus opacus]|uniref:cytochrome P450 n=1 Tax=Rhodococcus opacus TaxID=37919 RepID=UPI001C484AF6|nr:cytochrome P450 [Rhodococcus opacus]MBV6762902.1 cytochrome P450 [Rhodococcus opacus]